MGNGPHQSSGEIYMENFFAVPAAVRVPGGEEYFAPLLVGQNGLRVERIVSWGHVTPEDAWYDQDTDEWVLLVAGQARLAFADGREVSLAAGEQLFLPRGLRHRVVYTSAPCIWLAIHAEHLCCPSVSASAGHSPEAS